MSETGAPIKSEDKMIGQFVSSGDGKKYGKILKLIPIPEAEAENSAIDFRLIDSKGRKLSFEDLELDDQVKADMARYGNVQEETQAKVDARRASFRKK